MLLFLAIQMAKGAEMLSGIEHVVVPSELFRVAVIGCDDVRPGSRASVNPKYAIIAESSKGSPEWHVEGLSEYQFTCSLEGLPPLKKDAMLKALHHPVSTSLGELSQLTFSREEVQGMGLLKARTTRQSM